MSDQQEVEELSQPNSSETATGEEAISSTLSEFETLDFSVLNLGRRTVRNPIRHAQFISDDDKVLYPQDPRVVEALVRAGKPIPAFETAGPRKEIYFDPSKVRSAIVTAGGLCPGLNDVIRALVMQLYYIYGSHNIYGIRYGLQGFIPEYGHDLMILTPNEVREIHKYGGTILGSSRGDQDISQIVDALERMNVNILFMIGGDGTLKASIAIQKEIETRNLRIAVVCIPKTIDNDISYIQKSFGFETAFSIAVQAIEAAHNEALGAFNGVGLVKVMGRHSGFIAANAALAMREVNFVLIPEVDFDLEGKQGFLNVLKERILERRHAVVLVAEGAGQKYLDRGETAEYDPSGNVVLLNIGRFLRIRIIEYFRELEIPLTLKYIDPSYMIRSAPADPVDSVFAGLLAQNAVHAAMAGKTGLVVGRWGAQFTHMPTAMAVSERKTIDPQGNLWRSVLEATGQPRQFKDDSAA